ncbi:MAG: hypothetical protein KBS81_01355, partial [Spirochaetales bacterium]|nr:hypothetical protein [Candidatus Physcosoma equi]
GGARGTTLTLPADEYIDVDSVLIPTKETPTKVEGTAFDFREGKRIGERRDGRYDNSWILRKNAVVHAEGNRAELWCRTTEPAIQVYTGEFLSGEDTSPFLGLALETGRYPNTPNRPDFPQCFTENGIVTESTTSYCLKVKD